MPEKIKYGPFKGLLKNHYGVIHADPPWYFNVRSDKGLGRSADRHYATMSFGDIKKLPVADLAAKNCVLFLWITDPMLFRGMELMKAWGFEYKTVGFYWVKTNKNGKPFSGMGYWTRANPEQVLTNLEESQLLLSSKGNPKRLSTNVQKLIMSPRREHSRKPDEVYDNIEALVSGPYLDLFSRQRRPNWTTWGNETSHFPEIPEEDLIG